MSPQLQKQSRLLETKLPPQAIEAETALLGGCLLQSDAFPEASELLTENCFYLEDHKAVFRAMSSLNAQSRPIDCITVGEELKKTGITPYFLATLTNNVVSSARTLDYARLILEAHVKREIIKVSHDFIKEGYEPGDAFDLLDAAESAILSIRQLVDHKTYKTLDTILVETFKHLHEIRNKQGLTGVTSGYQDLDKVTCGWQESDLIILAARPSVGKTALALNLARNAANESAVGFFSLEMSDRSLIQRILSSESGLGLWYLRNGKLSDAGMKDLFQKGMVPLSKCKIFVDSTASLKISDFKAKARRMVLKDKVKIIFIDYLQLMTTRQRFERKDLEVGFISSQLKSTAKELNIPIVALSQLSRESDKNSREPVLSDLRHSGDIEQDADIVMFLWKPSESEIMGDPGLGEFCNLKIEKNRNGTLEKFLGKFKKETQKWEYVKVLDGSGMPTNTWKPLITSEPTTVKK
jgi:replicative DNA helicase